MIGKKVSHYTILEKIGAGGMGEVYRARDEHLQREVAVKFLPPGTLNDESARKRFRKEALTLSKLNHPGIETVHDFDTQDGLDFLVMELIPGSTLSARLSTGPLPEKEIIHLGRELAEALATAHEHGIVHRDLKPGNLMVLPDGRLKVLDFGLAALIRSGGLATTQSATESTGIAGTLPYMAPEQLGRNLVDTRTDIHAAGAILYEMASGRRPFREDTVPQLIDAILHQLPPVPSTLNSGISPGLDQIICKCLEKDPEHRYQSAKELAVDLRRLELGVIGVGQRQNPLRLISAKPVGTVLAILAIGLVLFVVSNVGGWREWLFGPSDIHSLAVLPLANLSGDAEQDYFADGMTEALITNLAQISALKVISRNSIIQYKTAMKALPQIARELNVEAVVTGSVARAGNRVRITAQLLNARTDSHLWARSYERELHDVFALQSEVASAVAEEINIRITPREKMRLSVSRRTDPEAYEYYLRGRAYADKFTAESVGRAVEYFQKAINKDPGYTLAYAAMGDAYLLLGQPLRHDLSESRARDILLQAKQAAQKALTLDEQLAEGHTVLAAAGWLHDWEWANSARDFQRGVELGPNSEKTRVWYAMYLNAAGRSADAIAQILRARELAPLSVEINAAVGEVYMVAREYGRAQQELARTVELQPDFARGLRLLANTLEAQGMDSEALDCYRRVWKMEGLDKVKLDEIEQAFKKQGTRGISSWILAYLEDESRTSYVRPAMFAREYANVGNKEKAFEWLEKAFQEHDGELVFLNTYREFDSLRNDARFKQFLHRINYPQ